MSSGVIIDGTLYDVPFVEVARKASVLDKYAERTEDGVLRREIIGVYYNYEISFGDTEDLDEYARLWDVLTAPDEFHEITAPGTGGNFTYTAYIANVSDKLRRTLSGANYWTDLTATFTAQAPARTP